MSNTKPGPVRVVHGDRVDRYLNAIFTYDPSGFLDVHTFEQGATESSGLATYAPGAWTSASYGQAAS